MSDAVPITVAVPTMNGGEHLFETLSSVLAQQTVRYDLLIADDRSEDQTREIAHEVVGDRARIVVNSERLGLAGNWNRCVALSQTPLIAILHQDDVWRAGHLAAQVQAFQEGVGLVASASNTLDAEGKSIPIATIESGGFGTHDKTFQVGEAVPLLASGNLLRCSAVALRVQAHHEAGGFDPSWKYVVDWDLWLKVARKWSVAWLAKPTVDVRWHLASETHRFAKGTRDLEETESILRRLKLENFNTKTGNRKLARAYLNRAYLALRSGDGELSKRCLTRAFSLRPSILSTILSDPKLALMMASTSLSPQWAGAAFRRND